MYELSTHENKYIFTPINLSFFSNRINNNWYVGLHWALKSIAFINSYHHFIDTSTNHIDYTVYNNKQAQHRAAGDRSQHKKYGEIQYHEWYFPT